MKRTYTFLRVATSTCSVEAESEAGARAILADDYRSYEAGDHEVHYELRGSPDGVLPIQPPPAEDLRDAVQMLEASGKDRLAAEDYVNDNEMRAAALVRSALTKLAEPSYHTIQRVQGVVPFVRFHGLDDREARDIAAVVLSAQLEGR